MYIQYLSVKPTDTGMGVFTSMQIPARVPIMEIVGKIYTEDKLPTDASRDDYLQIGPNLFIGLTGTVHGCDFYSHSCNPNCYVHIIGQRAIIYSLYVIPKDSELTFDYSLTSTDTLNSWNMNCKCGDPKCRGVISGWQYVPADVQSKYEQHGAVPLFISSPNLFQKRY